MVVFGTEPLSPIDLALQGTSIKDEDEGEVMETKLFLEERKRILELAKETLQRRPCKGPKALQKAGEQESKACDFQGRTEGVAECVELHIAVGPNPQAHG